MKKHSLQTRFTHELRKSGKYKKDCIIEECLPTIIVKFEHAAASLYYLTYRPMFLRNILSGSDVTRISNYKRGSVSAVQQCNFDVSLRMTHGQHCGFAGSGTGTKNDSSWFQLN